MAIINSIVMAIITSNSDGHPWLRPDGLAVPEPVEVGRRPPVGCTAELSRPTRRDVHVGRDRRERHRHCAKKHIWHIPYTPIKYFKWVPTFRGKHILLSHILYIIVLLYEYIFNVGSKRRFKCCALAWCIVFVHWTAQCHRWHNSYIFRDASAHTATRVDPPWPT